MSDSRIEVQSPDAQNNDPEHDSTLMNVNPSRNLFRKKDAQRLSALSSLKWFQILRSSPKVSCEVSASPSYYSSKVGENCKAESENMMHEKVTSLSSKTSSSDYSQGTVQFTMRANGTPHFVFKLEKQRDVYVASYVEDQSAYMIHLQRGESSSSSSSSSHLVGRIKVSTVFSEKSIERGFVLFSCNGRIPRRRHNRGLSKQVVDVIKNNQSISRLTCSWDQQFQETDFDIQQVNLPENDLPTNLETLAVVVKEETVIEETGGWGMKFLKKSPMVQTMTETSTSLTSMDVVIPSGVHGGPEDGPSSLIERWKSQGNCDCGGWDLGCSLTLLKGQPRSDQFELSIEGSELASSTGLRIVNVRGGLYLVKLETNLSNLQSFSIALAFVHSQKLRELRL